MSSKHPAHAAPAEGCGPEVVHATFVGASVVQLTGGADDPAEVEELVAATVEVTSEWVSARVEGGGDWIWFHEEVEGVWHGSRSAWTILAVPGVPDFGVAVAESDVPEFRAALRTAYPFDESVFWSPRMGRRERSEDGRRTQGPELAASDPGAVDTVPPEPPVAEVPEPAVDDAGREPVVHGVDPAEPVPPEEAEAQERAVLGPVDAPDGSAPDAETCEAVASPSPYLEPVVTPVDLPAHEEVSHRGGPPPGSTVVEPVLAVRSRPADPAPPTPVASTKLAQRAHHDLRTPAVVDLTDGADRAVVDTPTVRVAATPAIRPAGGPAGLAALEARTISAWFGSHHVLDRVTLTMHPGQVTALIGPSGCGKSTFLRILNRMHEMIPGASLAGEVHLDGTDIYDASRKLTDARRQIGMVFQKPNPFPAMSIYDNVVASFRLTGTKVCAADRDAIVESCLAKAGLWAEVRDRLRQPGGSLSGGQQQRLCIARALAIRPRVLLMDEPCSALDPTSTRRIEQTIIELRSEVTIVIVTHNMQQAARVSNQCAFFLAAAGSPGVIIEHGDTAAMFATPQDERTLDYVNGRFG